MSEFDSRFCSEALLKFEGYTDAQISVLFLYWLPWVTLSVKSNCKVMKELRFKYERTLEGHKYSKRNVTYNSVGNPYIFKRLTTSSFSVCVRLIVRKVFKFVAPI